MHASTAESARLLFSPHHIQMPCIFKLEKTPGITLANGPRKSETTYLIYTGSKAWIYLAQASCCRLCLWAYQTYSIKRSAASPCFYCRLVGFLLLPSRSTHTTLQERHHLWAPFAVR